VTITPPIMPAPFFTFLLTQIQQNAKCHKILKWRAVWVFVCLCVCAGGVCVGVCGASMVAGIPLQCSCENLWMGEEADLYCVGDDGRRRTLNANTVPDCGNAHTHTHTHTHT